jgi:hypothetical protein
MAFTQYPFNFIGCSFLPSFKSACQNVPVVPFVIPLSMFLFSVDMTGQPLKNVSRGAALFESFLFLLKSYGAEEREECSAFDKANFTRLVPRREPNSNNRPLKTNAGYNHCILLRQLGDPSQPTIAVPSTAATRAQGLVALKAFLRDPRFSKYPVDNMLRLMDMNENTTGQACDALLMDETIKELMDEDFDPDILAAGFVENFTEIAATCWGGAFYSDWAKDLGFSAV